MESRMSDPPHDAVDPPSPPDGRRRRRAADPPPAWRNRIVDHSEVDPAVLVANPANWRTHPTTQERAMSGALAEVGWVAQVLVNRTTGHVVDGHLRLELALARQESSVPVSYVELSLEEERLVLATLDPLGAMAEVDRDALAELLAAVTPSEASLSAMLSELADRTGLTMAGLTDPDAVLDVPDPADVSVRPGELYALGEHRLLCGDATSAEDVGRLLDGARPTLLVTDPPYGVALDQTWRDGMYNGARPRVHGWAVSAPAARPYMVRDADTGQPVVRRASRGRTNGHRRTTISGDVRADWSAAYALVPSLTVGYVWYASAHTLAVLEGLLGIGFELAQQVIWDKGLFSIGRSWYHWAHEPCVVVRRPGAHHPFIGTRDQATVWRAPSPKRLGAGSTEDKQDHPTQKPVVLSEIPIRNHLRSGEAVYEPFAGSGTTLVAAERLGRRCLAMEIEPAFVQLTIERWQAFTGRTAVRIDG